MGTMICVVHSRGLRDKAVRYAEELRNGNELVCVVSKKVSIKDSKGKFLSESEILQQKVDIVKSSDEVHILWDGECSEVPLLVGAAIAEKKKIVTSYVSPVSIKRFLWEKRPVKKELKDDKVQKPTKKNS
jgi:hypothetical protein